MITKNVNNYIGYGLNEEEALDSCKIISILKDTYNIKNFEGLEERRNILSPWKPKEDTLQISGVGYIKIKDGTILINKEEIEVSENLFEMLYKSFYSKLDMIDISICSLELQEFFMNNKIVVPKLRDYPQVVPTDVFLFDEDVKSHIITDKYNIVFLKDGRLAINEKTEEYYWTAHYDKSITSIIDILYYISYVRGYNGMEEVIEEGNVINGGVY